MTLRGAPRQLLGSAALRATSRLSNPRFTPVSQILSSRCFAASARQKAPHNDNSMPPQIPRQPARQPMPTQNQAEKAILNKLSTLTPEQITELLSSPPGTTSSAGSAHAATGRSPAGSSPSASSSSNIPQTPGVNPASPSGTTHINTVTTSSRTIFARYPGLLKWALRVTFALVAFWGGNEFAEYMFERSPFYWGMKSVDDPFVDLPPEFRSVARLNLAVEAASQYATTFHLFPHPDLLHDADEPLAMSPMNPTLDLVHYLARMTANAPKTKSLGESMLGGAAAASPGGRTNLAHRVAQDHVEPWDWPAHVALMANDPITQARKRRHLVAGAFDTPDTMGLVHHVFRDWKTGDMAMIIMFGGAMCGWPGLVHGGAMATVMDEAMGRVAAREFPAQTAVTARLEMQYATPLSPLDLVMVKMRPMSEEAARRKQRDFLVHDLLRKAEPGSSQEKRFKKMLAELDAPRGRGSGADEEESDAGAEAEQKKPFAVQTDRRMWLVARMERASDGELICEAEGLFVVPKGTKFKPLPKEW